MVQLHAVGGGTAVTSDNRLASAVLQARGSHHHHLSGRKRTDAPEPPLCTGVGRDFVKATGMQIRPLAACTAQASFDHPHNAAVRMVRRRRDGMLCSWAASWPGVTAGRFSTMAAIKGGGMPIPRVVRRWNKAGLNRVTRHIAPWVPGFGVVVHPGRRSGREYQTPVNVFATEEGYVLALTYGPDTDWVKNVLAAGGCELRTRGRAIRLVSPRLFHDEARRDIRPVERQVLRVLGVADFLSLKTAPAAPTTG